MEEKRLDNVNGKRKLLPFQGKHSIRIVLLVIIIVFMGNLSALVDTVIHPEIEYFDEEHLIVGGVVALVTTILFVLLFTYINRLEKTISELKTLEGLLPICSNCKKIRDTSSNWHQLEKYISERSDILFSHSICPECYKKLYSNLPKRKS